MKLLKGLLCIILVASCGGVQAVDKTRYSGTAKAEVINALRAGQKVLATIATASDANTALRGTAPILPASTTTNVGLKAQLDSATIAFLAEQAYYVLAAALEEGDLIMKARNVFIQPVVKSHVAETQTGQTRVKTPKGLLTNPGLSKQEVITCGRQMTKSFLRETAHATVAKLADLYIPGDENRIIRRSVKLALNTVLDGLIGFGVNYLKHADLNNLKDTKILVDAWGNCYDDAIKTLLYGLVYEALGEILIRAIEGEDGVTLLEAFKLTGIADFFNQLAQKVDAEQAQQAQPDVQTGAPEQVAIENSVITRAPEMYVQPDEQVKKITQKVVAKKQNRKTRKR